MKLNFQEGTYLKMTEEKFGADLIVDSLINHEVKYILGFQVLKLIRFLILWSIKDLS